MNVTPVSTPGLASSGPIRVDDASAPTTAASNRGGHVLQPQTGATTERAASSAPAPLGQLPTSEDRQKAEQLRSFIADDNVRVSTRHDEASGRSIVEVRDQTTGDVVSQYPTEELVRLYAALRESLVDQSA